MVRCPKCGSKRVSKEGSKWKCYMCRCIFTSSSGFNDFDVDAAFAQVEQLRRERREKERLEQEKLERERRERREKERLEQERLERERRDREDRERRERLARERREKQRRERLARERREKKERERLARERREKERQERIEREKKGFFTDKSLALLKNCSRRDLGIIYNKINIPKMESKKSRLNYIANKYTTKDIERMIKEAERERKEEEKRVRREKEEKERKQRERREKERKAREEDYKNSVSLLEECGDDVLDILTLNNLPSNTEERDERIDLLAKKFKPKALKHRISMADKEIEKERLLKANTDKWTVIFIILLFLAFFVLIMALNELGL